MARDTYDPLSEEFDYDDDDEDGSDDEGGNNNNNGGYSGGVPQFDGNFNPIDTTFSQNNASMKSPAQ